MSASATVLLHLGKYVTEYGVKILMLFAQFSLPIHRRGGKFRVATLKTALVSQHFCKFYKYPSFMLSPATDVCITLLLFRTLIFFVLLSNFLKQKQSVIVLMIIGTGLCKVRMK